MTFKKKVIIALDTDNLLDTEKLVDLVKDDIFAVKIGYQFFFKFGLAGYERIKNKNVNIFLDLKLHDIPNTVKHGIKSISELNPYFTTIHISGGDKMIKEAIDNKRNTKILGVSILTSLNQDQINVFYPKNKLEDIIDNYINYALVNNLDGIVCSPHEIKKVKKIAKDKLIIVTPGIRPLSYLKNDDQKRIMSPSKAISLGSNYIVIGRPITQSSNPLNEIKNINLEIEKSEN